MGGVAVSFTGGKDSVLALHLAALNISLDTEAGDEALNALRAAAAAAAAGSGCGTTAAACSTISLLVTFAPAGHDRPGQGFKAHPIPVIRAQARALGIPHIVCEVDPLQSPLEEYMRHMRMLHQQHGITELVTGDILDVAGRFMQRAVKGTGVTLVTPLWQLPRSKVLAALHALGIDSMISCINVSKYGAATTAVPGLLRIEPEARAATGGTIGEAAAAAAAGGWDAVVLLLGQRVTPELVAGPLAEAQQLFGADLGGELGEYHTLVLRAPLFSQPVELAILEVVRSGDYAYVMLDVPTAQDPDGFIVTRTL